MDAGTQIVGDALAALGNSGGLRDIREASGWTQEQVAEAVGVSRVMVSYYERALKMPSGPRALSYAAALGNLVEIAERRQRWSRGQQLNELTI